MQSLKHNPMSSLDDSKKAECQLNVEDGHLLKKIMKTCLVSVEST